jgi:phage portal protein BeeE
LRTIKDDIRRKFRGNKTGEPLVLSGPTTVEKLGFDYSSVGMREVRRIPEERFCSVIGISPQSLRLGLGQENSTYNNVEGYTRLDYQDYIKPLQREIAKELEKQLLPEFGDTNNLMVGWNYDEVGILQADKYKEAERIERLFKARVLNLAQAKEAMSYKPVEGDEKIYYPVPQTNVTISPIGESTPEPFNEPVVKPNGAAMPS